jgi:flavin-dependent dehydrogenase
VASNEIRFTGRSLPVLYRADVVVVGGSLAGIAAALALVRRGRSVIVVEPRTYPGREITATLRPWLRLSGDTAAVALPEPLAACVDADSVATATEEILFHMDGLKGCLEDQLVAAGVRLLYASLPVAVEAVDGRLQGIVVGNKSGRQFLPCRAVVDATETALVARLAGTVFADPTSETAYFCQTVEFTGVAPIPGPVLPVPEHLGIVGDQVVVRPGRGASGHCYVECKLALPRQAPTALEMTRRDLAARRRCIDLAAYLLSQVPEFKDAYLAALSYELHGPHTQRMADTTPTWAQPLASDMLDLRKTNNALPLTAFAGPVSGLWCLNEAARLDEEPAALLREPAAASRLGASLARQIDRHWQVASAPAAAGATPPAPPEPATGLQVKEPAQPQRGRGYEQHAVATLSIPLLRSADVLVVGGGTSGATAAITAGRQGLRTVLVEMNPGLGGTGTYGGIHSYWFGRRVGFAADVVAMVDRMHDRLHHKRQSGPIPSWNIEAKVQALTQEAEAAGVEMLLNALFIGTIVEGDAVRGVVVATRSGPVALLGKVTLDASGDGDVAAFAGAEYVYGSERDHVAMYSYMPQVPRPGLPRNVKTSMVDVSNVEDYTRAILEERRRRKEGDYDHGIYLAPRESRHIRADVVLSLTDQLVRRCWPDVINIAFSNNDIKGQSTSDWVLIGLISPHLEIEIPYRALLPRGLENILVIGKAFSATHDALAAPRMQPDIENLGGVAALAATLAVRGGRTPREVDVRMLQEGLVAAGVLPEQVLDRRLVPMDLSEAELEVLVEDIGADRPLHAYSDMEINEVFQGRIPLVDALCAGPRVVPVLERALSRAEGPRRTLLAMALAMAGSDTGVPTLVSAIEGQLSGKQLPRRDSQIRHVGFPPDQGAAADVVYLIYALGLARDRRALPIWQRVVDLLAAATPEEIFDRELSLYHYVAAVCFGAERLGDPATIPILEQLHSYAPLSHQLVSSGFQPDFFQERLAYLEVVIGRALARCGSPDGLVILISYLGDQRALLAEHAHTELVAITGQDLGKNVAAWSEWLEAEGDKRKPVPWQAPTDPMRTWGTEILIEPAERKQAHTHS